MRTFVTIYYMLIFISYSRLWLLKICLTFCTFRVLLNKSPVSEFSHNLCHLPLFQIAPALLPALHKPPDPADCKKLTAKKEDDKAIGQAFDALLAKKDWSELKALSHAAKSYHPTEVVEGEIARLLADKEKKQ